MNVSDLSGTKLDYYVAKALGHEPRWWANMGWTQASAIQQIVNPSKWAPVPKYSTDWGAGGPLIEEMKIELILGFEWNALKIGEELIGLSEGTTPLIAICRCIVKGKFCDEVPEIT